MNDNKNAAPSQWRKKPVVIDAMQTTEETSLDVLQWVRSNGGKGNVLASGALLISTLEGEMKARCGDWVIRGVQGEFYPCAADIFRETYERVTSPGASL